MKKTKILFVVSNFNIGGTERHLLQLLPRLQRKFNIRVYVTHEKGVLSQALEEQGVKLSESKAVKFLHRCGKLGRWMAYFISMARLTGIMIAFRPDIVHSYLQGPYIMASVCGFFARQKKHIMSRRIFYGDNPENRQALHLEKKCHPRLTLATACSEEVKNELFAEGLSKEKLITIYNGVDLNRFKYLPPRNIARKEQGLSPSTFVILIVANLYPRKGHQDLLSALSLIKDQLPTCWRLISLGRDAGELNSLKKYCNEHDLENHVDWIGQVENVLPYLCSADIGVLSSYFEGFSNALLESMAVGLPMIVTDISGNNEAVDDERSGFIVPVASPPEMASALLKLAHDKDKRLAFSRHAKQTITEKFSLDVCVSNYESMYAAASSSRGIDRGIQ